MLWSRLSLPLLLLISLSAWAQAEEDSLVARWDFGTEEATPLVTHGGVQVDQPGPQAPEFPDFAKDNTAVRLDGKGAYLAIEDPGTNSPYDFTNGDAVTLEAWVRLDGNLPAHPLYIIGKGRTGGAKFARDNQNWSLRIVGKGDVAQLSFLFATDPGPGEDHWHRWTSEAGFNPQTGWHHVALAYEFGKPETIKGWIDGQPTDGKWDLGGATKDAPIVDDDAVWIGSSQAGNPGNSFKGWLDEVMIHRSRLDEKVMQARFNRVGGPRVVKPKVEKMPEIADLPAGQVLVTLAEGLPTHDRWLNDGETWPKENDRWLGDSFLLTRIPLRYDDWGIRDSWKAPVLLRMAADVELPPGKHRFMLRARALGRLWVDGKVVARTKPCGTSPPSAHQPVSPLVMPAYPDMHLRGYHQQEVFGDAEITAGPDGQPKKVRVILELVVGAKNNRTETGEVTVAVEGTDGTAGQMYYVLQPSHTLAPLSSAGVTVSNSAAQPLPLTASAVPEVLARIEDSLAEYDDRNRRQAAASQNEFWQRRHSAAKDWAQANPAPAVPQVKDQQHPVDAFVQAKINAALTAAQAADKEAAKQFHQSVLPVLSTHCFRCHGEKDKGGFKLDSLESAVKGGDSEAPGVVPGKPDESELIARIKSEDESLRMPPTGDPLPAEQIAVLEKWIQDGAQWPAPPISQEEVALAPVVEDDAFIRRIYLDMVGVPPSAAEVKAFLSDKSADKREKLIDQLLTDERGADHWISFWQDLLAENPTLLNQSLNSSGPFRFFLYDALRDQMPLDRMITELLMMRGSPHEGGSAGFAMAGENDSPFAAKGHVVAAAFLGIELQCARCHDSPYHSTTQRDLYSLAAMFNRKSLSVPKTSRVPSAFFEEKARDSLIRVTLKEGEPVKPEWPFEQATGVADGDAIDGLMYKPDDSRERLAALITAPQNVRFSRVMVNHLWKRLIGAGFVEPAHDWEGREASHPELLDWLAHELVAHDYDVQHVIRLIVTSQTYQRESTGKNLAASAELRFFNAPERRRLTAEQIVDSLHASLGREIDAEPLTFVHDGRRSLDNRADLGQPTRAWMFASLNNERDRPSLSMPRSQTVVDVLQAFGWTGSRQRPIHERDTDPNVLQPGILANGTLTLSLTRASVDSLLADLAVEAESPEELVDTLFLRVLSRYPQAAERKAFSEALAPGFDSRLVPADQIVPPPELPRLELITWFNHLSPRATEVQKEIERRTRLGPPADPRLQDQWREVVEDVAWSLINHSEFVWMP